jgi:hypothetical protein
MSFNTTVERTTLTGSEAAQYLDELDKAQGNSRTNSGNAGRDLGPRPMDAS